jgi:Transglycosylase-like domain
MNKVNIILLIMAMFTGFPAIIAFSQNVITATQTQANFPKTSSIALTNLSISFSSTLVSSVVASASSINSSSLIASSSEILSSSSVISSESKIEIKEEPKPIEVVEVPAPVQKTEVKTVTTKVIQAPAPKIEIPVAPVKAPEVIKPVELSPVVVAVSSVVISSKSVIPEVAVVKPTAIAPVPQSTGTYADQIKARCEILGCNPSQMIGVMYCESGGNPSITDPSGTYIGLFQFLPQTFNSYKIRSGLPNGSIYNGSDQIHVATYMFANGMEGQWPVCQYRNS